MIDSFIYCLYFYTSHMFTFIKLSYFPQAEQLMKQIGVEGVSLTEYELNIATHLVDPRSIKVTANTVIISANLSSNHTVPLITSVF